MSRVTADVLKPGTVVLVGQSSFSGKINKIPLERKIVRFRYKNSNIFWLSNEKPLVLDWGNGQKTKHESGGFKYMLKDIKAIA